MSTPWQWCRESSKWNRQIIRQILNFFCFDIVIHNAVETWSHFITEHWSHATNIRPVIEGPFFLFSSIDRGWCHGLDCTYGNYLCAHHDDVIKWKHFPRYWPFVRGIHRSPVNSPHKGQWRRALMFSLICVWINGWVNNREAGDLRRYRLHYDVIVMAVQNLTPGVWVTKRIFSVPLFFQFFYHYQNSGYLLNIMFVFVRCHRPLTNMNVILRK